MNILITGGTGFIGSALCSFLIADGHTLVVVSRSIKRNHSNITYVTQIDNSMQFDVVINLAGEPIANKCWSHSQKSKIQDSRINTTTHLIDYFKNTRLKPSLFISGSAIGFYGINTTNQDINETAKGDDSFSSTLCKEWETTALAAQALGIRTCLLRTGIVLGKKGGALNKMLPPFKLGLGGKIGSGQQWMPWIHIDDMVGLITLCIDNKNINGAINCTAPFPVTNSAFTKALSLAVNRPTLLPIPAWLIKLLMGQMGQELLLSGKKVVPAKALASGYQFKFEQINDALNDVINT
ncbi:TIGR01777 family oxidoreductase [Psychrosphaera aquimarina]|uniref:TIGR01777 family oxidoreductase n=1 Tax=Psychrosphaera aquimarina TaxID=2044854 RepID=A0ABU3QYQ3_9GAMM|nr:TIGR01777 family oxidoreductase [Psychrosphaera aquimarina]MDU0112569.1 TIGR01777 family oxidoreductase [Psychrosphaera aquimarina]